MVGVVAIVGCGLLGGSVLKGLRAKGWGRSIVGVDRQDVLASALPLLDDGAEPGSAAALSLLASADLIVLATPVNQIVASLVPILDRLSAAGMVTDVGSVKRPMLDAVAGHPRAGRYLAGHPIAGREQGGFGVSAASLFEGTRWLLVPDGADDDVLARVTELVTTLGATPVLMEAAEHDRSMAYVSHLPQLVASSLVGVANRAGVLADAGAGFRDLTRIAGGPSAIWRDIFASNRADLAVAVQALVETLEGARRLLEAGDDTAIERVVALLEEARKARPSDYPG